MAQRLVRVEGDEKNTGKSMKKLPFFIGDNGYLSDVTSTFGGTLFDILGDRTATLIQGTLADLRSSSASVGTDAPLFPFADLKFQLY